MLAGRNQAEHGFANMVADVPAAFKDSYTEGFNYGLQIKDRLKAIPG